MINGLFDGLTLKDSHRAAAEARTAPKPKRGPIPKKARAPRRKPEPKPEPAAPVYIDRSDELIKYVD